MTTTEVRLEGRDIVTYLKKYRDNEEYHEQLHANMLDNNEEIEKQCPEEHNYWSFVCKSEQIYQ